MGVNLKILCKWFVVTRNYSVESSMIHEVVDTSTLSIEARNEKSIHLFEIDLCEGMKKTLNGEDVEWWTEVSQFCQETGLLLRSGDAAASNGKSWKKTYRFRLSDMFCSVYEFASTIDESMKAREFERFGNVAVCNVYVFKIAIYI